MTAKTVCAAKEALKPFVDLGLALGENVITSDPVQKVGQAAMTGCAGAAVIGAGTALETGGALIATAGAVELGGALASAGYAITGTGCTVANAAITTVSTVAGESLVGGAIVTGLETLAGAAVAVASSPAVIIGGGVALCVGGIFAFINWLDT